MWIDSHAHIDGREFDADRAEVLARARAAGVSPIVTVGTGPDLASIRRAADLADRERDVFATAGVHPHDAAKVKDDWWPELEALARRPRVVAVGEIGLDFYYEHSERDVQADVFRRHIALAHAVGKPIVCHIRDAHVESAAILREAGVTRGVIHCFTGGPDDAARYVELGLCISFSGIVTFKTAEAIRAAVKIVPREQILVETDCPYLAPVPMRGKRNEPAYVVHTAEVVAREAGIALADFAALTAANTRRVFDLDRVPAPEYR